jgi:hypothetical protein
MTEQIDGAPGNGARYGRCRGWTPRGGKARTVGELVPGLMRPVFEKYGFSSAAILTDWPALAGPDLAAYTAPERLKWPRRRTGEADGQPRETGATLILRVAGARALEVEHRRGQIIERLNASFGYRAVAEIRVVQAPLKRREAPAPRAAPEPAPASVAALAAIREDRLRAAIAQLGSGIRTARERRS